MVKVKVLIIGYTSADNPESESERTCSTVTLVQDKGFNMVIDPGVMGDVNQLISALAENGLKPADINMVGLTHSHIDHYRNLGLFPQAKVLEYYGIWDNDTVEDRPESLSPSLKIIETPGHSREGITFLAETELGIVAVCGDVFWKENLPEKDPYADDPTALAHSRQKVMDAADWIVPGHGDIYKIKK